MRGDSYILKSLPEEIVGDWYEGRIFTEHDVQSSAYFHLRRHFAQSRSASWLLRNQPVIRLGEGRPTIKPDFALFKNTKLFDLFELKCCLGVDVINEARVEADLEKIRSASRDVNIRHAYLILVCDDTDGYRFDRKANDWSHGLLSVVIANVYCHPDSKRKRRNYEAVRERWERLKQLHAEPLLTS